MFERFTERARQVVVLAQQSARNTHSRAIICQHILVGLIGEEEGLAARVLQEHHIHSKAVEDTIPAERDEPIDGQIPFSVHAKKTLELALREALALGHNYIGTEHILLALSRFHSGDEDDARDVALILDAHGLTGTIVRNKVVSLLMGPQPKPGSVDDKWLIVAVIPGDELVATIRPGTDEEEVCKKWAEDYLPNPPKLCYVLRLSDATVVQIENSLTATKI